MEPDKSGEGSVKPSDAAASVSAELKQEIQKIVMGIVPDIVKRTVTKAVQESMPSALEKIAEEATKAAAPKKSDDDKSGENGRSYKALETQLTELRQQLQKRDEALEQKEQQRIDALMRSEVQSILTGIVGAENPNLPFVMDSLYDTRKRFVRGEDGQTLVKFRPEYGTEDELLPLGSKDTQKRLSAELKHVLPSKTEKLPVVARRGAPAQQGQPGSNVLDSIFSNIASQAASAIPDPTQK